MAREFRLPDIGEGLTEAEIVRWLVAEGEHVEADQPVVEVETDKAVVEIPSPYRGIVVSHGGAEGDVIEVGHVLVTIADPGEEMVSAESAMPVSRAGDDSVAAPIVGTLSEEAEVLSPPADRELAGRPEVKALPIVRKLARDHGIDLSTIEGTGPGGRVMREDIEAVLSGGSPEASAPDAGKPETVLDAGEQAPVSETAPLPDVERRSMSRLRRTIAANMAKSWSEIPHVTTFDDVDATRLLEVRAALGERHQAKIPVEALVVKAVVPALEAFPEFNATLDGDDLLVHADRHIGIAVDTPEGLLVAVIRDVDKRSVMDLASEVRRLGEGARERSLTPDQLGGQTFTVSNIGAVGGGHGTPIVPHGTTAILSVGAARIRPVVYDGDLGIAPVMPLSLSYDHRVIDGAVGRRFMSLIIENLEEPALFLAG